MTDTKKVYSDTGEYFNYETLNDLINDNDLSIGDKYYVADAKEIKASDYVNVDIILESMDEQFYEDVGDIVDSEFTSISQESKDELESFLKEWVIANISNSRYYKCTNSKEMIITSNDF